MGKSEGAPGWEEEKRLCVLQIPVLLEALILMDSAAFEEL